jgi:hypothetical protein
MQTFKDSAAREWTLVITVGALRRVKAATGLELSDLSAGTPPLAMRLSDEATLLFAVIEELIAPQLKEKGVRPEQFEESLTGLAAAAAATAFFQELADFFRPWKPGIATLIDDLRREHEPAGNPSTPSPGSSESTPTP